MTFEKVRYDELLAALDAARAEIVVARREAEEARDQARRLNIEAMAGGVAHVGLDGSIVAANAEARRSFGLKYDETTGKYTREFDFVALREEGGIYSADEFPIARTLATGEAQTGATVGVNQPDGTTLWVLLSTVPIRSSGSNDVTGVAVTFLDITDRRRIEMHLRHNEELLRSIFESSPNPIATADRDGMLLSISRSPPTHSPAEVTGKLAWAYIVPEDQPRVAACVQRVIASGKSESCDARGVSGHQWRARIGPRYQSGEIVGVTFISWDISEQTELETRLAIADRMASIGTLAAGVAHEINNPITYVLANLEALESECFRAGNPKILERISAALEGSRRIRSIVSDLGTFSYIDERHRVPLDVRQLCDSAIRLAHNEIRFRARVQKRYAATPPVLAVHGQLGQVFLNLVVNAAQAIPEGNADQNEIALSTGVDDNGRVIVEVRDSGVGIPPDMIAKIFEPFVTTKPRGVGTGLGLYICRNIVTAIGGELSVKSTPGVGTTFRVTLPASHEALPETTAVPPEEIAPETSRRLRILVADDERAIGTMLQDFLVEHDVSVVRSGHEAVELLSKHDFDLVFCDLVMPDLTGMDVYDELSRRSPGREGILVFMTGGAFTSRAREFLQRIPNVVLNKPFALREILDVIRRHERRTGG